MRQAWTVRVHGMSYWTGGLDSEMSVDSEGGCPMDISWTSIGQVDWTSYGSPLERWTGQDSGTSLVSEGGMSNGHLMDIHWTGGLNRTAGQAWSVRVGCPMDIHWTCRGDNPKWTEYFDGKLGRECRDCAKVSHFLHPVPTVHL